MRQVDLEGKRVLEIGPAALDHVPFWTGKPARFTCLDINQDAIDIARARLEAVGVASEGLLLDRPGETQFPIADESFDVVLSFYAFEHIHPLAPHVAEVHRVLKSGGVLAGAIPCEGGLGWGLGRYLTSRRWLKSNTTIDPDKIICWEHPNFADRILSIMTDIFPSGQVSLWPLRVPLIDVNLIARFVLTKA
jgi:SAM-dependent methyltransferase